MTFLFLLNSGLAIALGASLAACGTHAATQGQASQFRTLAIGESLRLGNPEVTILFVRVREDSRCPTGAQCVWEGDAVAELTADRAGGPTETIELHTNSRFVREVVVAGHRIRLEGLEPQPATGQAVDAAAYRASISSRPER